MLGRMSRRMEDLGDDIAERQDAAVIDAVEWRRGLGACEQYVLGARGIGQTPACRHVVGMDVRVDDVEDAHAGRFGSGEIGRDVADGIDNGSRRLPATAEEVGDRHRISVQEWTQDHDRLPVARRISFNNYVE